MPTPTQAGGGVATYRAAVGKRTGIKLLPDHLHRAYGIDVTAMKQLDIGVFRVDRSDGPTWVARMFSAARTIEAVEGDAEILRYLEANDIPAERCATEQPVSVHTGQGVLVTEFVDGGTDGGSGESLHRLGDILGRVHTLPAETGAPARPAGSWHHLSMNGGSRGADVAMLLPMMAEVAEDLEPTDLPLYDSLRAELESLDDCTDLPHALINIDFGGPNVIAGPTGPVTIDWTGAGRGPRLLSLGVLMYGGRDLRLVDAFVAGYRNHIELEPDELDRLAGALRVHSLVLDCWGFVFRRTPLAALLRSRAETAALTEVIAKRTRQAFAADSHGSHESRNTRSRSSSSRSSTGRSSTGSSSSGAAAADWQAVPAASPMAQAINVLRQGVAGQSDDQIAAFAATLGGFGRLCHMVFQGMRVALSPADCSVGFVLGDDMGWVFRAASGKVTVSKRVAKKAGAIVHVSPADFLRLVTFDVDWATAIQQGRVRIEGDVTHVQKMYGIGTA